jgi:hypothetical protein
MEEHNREILLAIGRVEGKLDGILGAQLRHESRLDKHDHRLGILERWQARVLGMGAAAGAGASFLLKLIGVH